MYLNKLVPIAYLLTFIFLLPFSQAGAQDFTKIEIDKAQEPLEEWLPDNKKIQKNIVWVGKDNSKSFYRNWSDKEKNDLQEMYEKVINGNISTDNYPPENLYNPKESEAPVETIITKNDAWELYLMNIATSIAVERHNLVNWSILSEEYAPEDMWTLFNSYFFFEYKGEKDGKNLYKTRTTVLPANPKIALDFLSDKILSLNRFETIYALIDWSTANLAHFTYRFELENAEWHWNYAGNIPIDRIIDGTVREGEEEMDHYTAGCFGTTDFYISVLRTINIPVKNKKAARHTAPHFSGGIDLYLSHGDDPYGRNYAYKPAIHPKELLIDEKTWNEWFENSEEPLSNVGRRTDELAVKHISHYLLYEYCKNQKSNSSISKKEGKVYEILSDVFTLSELKEKNLWERMDNELSEIGGCEVVNRERPSFYGLKE